MAQVKRKLILNQSSKEERKKLRNDFNRCITCIENFSNEFFYEIFDYLDGYKIYKAFSNLNSRFQQLLNSSTLLFKIKLNYSKPLKNYKQFFYLNNHQIFSIKLQLEYDSNYFFSLLNINSSLTRLESLFIRLKQSDILISLLIKFACLPRLFSLTIQPCGIPDNLSDIYRLIFALPVLKSCRFILDRKHDPISLSMATNKQLSPIEYFSIYQSTFNELWTILSYTPQLRRLNLLNNIDIDTNIQTILPITLSNLTDISIPMDSVRFDEFEILIRKINANLKILRVSIQSQDMNFLNAYRWERLILQSLPQLKEFYLRYHEGVDDQNKYSIYSGGANQFTSLFWIERQWIFEAEIIGTSINYLIRPYRKRWYDYTQEMIYSKSTRLIITHIYCDELVRRNTTRVLTIAQIYHLEIPEEKVPVSTLIEAVNLLPELETLKIHSLSLYEPRSLNSEELIILSSIEDTSQITKVYLETMNEIKEFDFLLELCPYMEYLKIDYIKRMDFKFLLRYIVKKIEDDGNDYLRLLCFRIPTADDEMIQKFKRMIRCEKLLFNFTIKRVADNIYLEWE